MSSQVAGLLKIPVLDLSKHSLKAGGSSSWKSSCDHVRQALEDYGFFIATCDNVSMELHNAVFESLEDLFHRPLETKLLNTNDKPFHGYFGQQPLVPIQESMGIENAHILSQTQSFTNLMWPQGNTKFCESVNAYSKQVSEFDQLVKSMVFESYGVKNYLESHMESTNYLMRVIKYRVAMEEETKMGSFPHKDKSFITILHQNEVNGLEVKTKDNNWVALELFPSSFVVMAGEASTAWSNGRIHSPVHRVVMEEEKIRYSIGLFSFINGTIEIPQQLVDDNHPLLFKPFHHFGMLRFYADNIDADHEASILNSYCLAD